MTAPPDTRVAQIVTHWTLQGPAATAERSMVNQSMETSYSPQSTNSTNNFSRNPKWPRRSQTIMMLVNSMTTGRGAVTGSSRGTIDLLLSANKDTGN